MQMKLYRIAIKPVLVEQTRTIFSSLKRFSEKEFGVELTENKKYWHSLAMTTAQEASQKCWVGRETLSMKKSENRKHRFEKQN